MGDIGAPLSGFITVVVKYGSTPEIPRLQAKNASELTTPQVSKVWFVMGKTVRLEPLKRSVVPAKAQSGPESDILDAKEACRYLRISLRTLRRYTSEGRITFLRYSAQALRFRKADLDAFLDSVMVKAA